MNISKAGDDQNQIFSLFVLRVSGYRRFAQLHGGARCDFALPLSGAPPPARDKGQIFWANGKHTSHHLIYLHGGNDVSYLSNFSKHGLKKWHSWQSIFYILLFCVSNFLASKPIWFLYQLHSLADLPSIPSCRVFDAMIFKRTFQCLYTFRISLVAFQLLAIGIVGDPIISCFCGTLIMNGTQVWSKLIQTHLGETPCSIFSLSIV